MPGVLTVPNFITLIRFACIPWFVWLVAKDNLSSAAYLLAVLGSTDWVDGWVARRFNQVSTFGKVFDPTVDRIMLVVAAVSLLIVDAMPLWFGAAALGRELVIIVVGLIIYAKGAARIDVQFIGKAGAMGLMISLPLFLVSVSGVTWHDEARILAWLFGLGGLLFSWLSLIGYGRLARVALKKGRHHDEVDAVSAGSPS